MTNKPPYRLPWLSVLAIIWIAYDLGAHHTLEYGPKTIRFPRELTDNERAQPFIRQPTEPQTIILHIVPPDQFRREIDDERTVAFTSIHRDPCEITIPAGWTIMAIPAKGRAVWEDGSNNETLTHEILHCIRGSWHPPWPKETAHD